MRKTLTTTLFALIFTVFGLFCNELTIHANTVSDDMRDISTFDVVSEMAPGINLYNTLDAYGTWVSGLNTETCWGNPFTTAAMIQSMADRGFNSIRIPVTWKQHMGEGPEFTIDDVWMDRVEEVVNYGLNAGMYVIVNIHHDDEWIIPLYDKQDESSKQLSKIWTQIAVRFKDYDDHLLFETLNEPRQTDSPYEWTSGQAEHRNVINNFNKIAVDAIRATGGNNEKRFISIPQYCANFTAAKESIVIPNNDERIIVAVHNYSPYNFCLNTDGTARWGTYADIQSLQNEIQSYAQWSKQNNRAIYIGECGASNKDNYGDRVIYYHELGKVCSENNITALLWMINFDRSNLSWDFPLVEQAFIDAYKDDIIYPEKIDLKAVTDTLYAGDSLLLETTITPSTASCQDVAYTSYDKSLATVSSRGVVRAQGNGTVIISATAIGKTTQQRIIVADTLTDMSYKIEAEDFESQLGVQVENCSDDQAGKDLGNIENGDWSKYNVDINVAGFYTFNARVATATNGGDVKIYSGSDLLGQITVEDSKSNGWQDWYTSASTEIELSKGKNSIQLLYTGGSGYLFNINWFSLEYRDPSNQTTILTPSQGNCSLQCYPNPTSDHVNIKYQTNNSDDLTISLINTHGQTIKSFVPSTDIIQGEYTKRLSLDAVERGVYFIRIEDGKKIQLQKILIN